MARRAACVLAAWAACSAGAWADEPGERAERPPPATVGVPTVAREPDAAAWTGRLDLGLFGGVLSGDGINPYVSPQVVVDLDAAAEVERGPWRVKIPVRGDGRITTGAPLHEFAGSAELAVRWRPDRAFWITPEVGLKGVRRPAWDDRYQPLPADPFEAPSRFVATDRYSFRQWWAQAEIGTRPTRGLTLVGRYRYQDVAYVIDPNFLGIDDLNAAPMHLTPGTHIEHSATLSARYSKKRVRIGAGASGWHRDYTYTYARDGGTGFTHTTPGFGPPNPLQTLQGVEPWGQAEWRPGGGAARVGQWLGYQVQHDAFEGYYSYAGPHSRTYLGLGKPQTVRLDLDLDVDLRRYGPRSYQAAAGYQPGDAGHPPLKYGDRRVDRRIAVGGELQIPLAKWIDLSLRGHALSRRTNFPDYVPGVFPVRRNYDIRWSYDNWAALGGVVIHR